MASGAKTKEATSELGNELSKIQDILFGHQVRQFEARFEKLEHDLSERTERLHDNLQKQLGNLETNINKQLATLQESLNDERLERSSQDERLAAELEAVEARFNESLKSFNHHVDTTFGQMEEARQQDNETIRQELTTLSKQFQNDLEKAVATLQDQKTDRRALAGFFNDLAKQLVPRGED
jgi:DNA anti-recombination protein RmuC